MPETVRIGNDNTETKVVQVNDGKGTQHAMMMTRATPGKQSALESEGFGSETVFFTLLVGPDVFSHYDPYKLIHENSAFGTNDFVFWLANAISANPKLFDRVEDSTVVTPATLREIKNERQD